MLDKLLEWLVAGWHLVVPFWVVNQYQRTVVLRFGVFHRELQPGFHWRWPFADQALDHNVVPRVHRLQPQSVNTSDGCACVVQLVLTWRVSDVKKLLLEVEDAENAIQDAAQGVLASRIARASWAELISPEFLEETQKDMRKRAFRWGVEIMQAQFSDLQRCKSLRIWQESRAVSRHEEQH